MEYGELHFRKDKNGKTVGYMYYRDSMGKRRQAVKTAKAAKVSEAKKELRAWADQKRREGETHPVANDPSITVEYVITAFLDEQLRRGFLEKSTHYSQMTNARNNVFPYIGQLVFRKVRNTDISTWLTELAEKGLSQSTIHTVYAIVRKTYNHYQLSGDIDYNPCDYVKSPRKGGSRITFLDDDQINNLICCLNDECEEGDHFWTAVNIAVLSGLRRGEICGLRFHSIDFKRKTLTVETAIGISKDGTYPKNPKNKNSARTFPIAQQLVEVLECRKRYLEKRYGTFDGSWFVVGETVNYKSPSSLSSEFADFAKRNGIVDHYGKEVTLHSLRHNMATFGVKNNVDIASMANMMGHTRTVMLETYAAADPAAMKLAADMIGEAFSGEMEVYEL